MPRRRLALAWLAGAVIVAHLWLAGRTLPPRLGEGAATPARMEVSFVRELAPAAPPQVAPAPPPPPKAVRRQLQSALADPGMAASAAAPLPALPSVASDAPAAELAAESPSLDLPDLPELAQAAVPASAAATGDNPALEWPPSTRLSYKLTGNYRGPVEGQAQVEWLRKGTRYQVFMDLSIGPSFAPLASRRVSSEGVIDADGLHPQRYDEVTEAFFSAARNKRIDLDEDMIRLPDAPPVPRPPRVQDSASQFVQLTWLFTTRPALLKAGSQIVIPLALPRRVEPWIYDVLETETLATPAGPVEAVHVKPRREAKPGRDLTAEVWVAPSLQYLPVRILIRQDAETFLDLLIERLPQQAVPPPASGSTAGSTSRSTSNR